MKEVYSFSLRISPYGEKRKGNFLTTQVDSSPSWKKLVVELSACILSSHWSACCLKSGRRIKTIVHCTGSSTQRDKPLLIHSSTIHVWCFSSLGCPTQPKFQTSVWVPALPIGLCALTLHPMGKKKEGGQGLCLSSRGSWNADPIAGYHWSFVAGEKLSPCFCCKPSDWFSFSLCQFIFFQKHSLSPGGRKEKALYILRWHEKFFYTILVSPDKLPFRINTKKTRRVGMIGQCPSSLIPQSVSLVGSLLLFSASPLFSSIEDERFKAYSLSASFHCYLKAPYSTQPTPAPEEEAKSRPKS